MTRARLYEIKARKEFVCNQCEQTIQKGEKYWAIKCFRLVVRFCYKDKPSEQSIKSYDRLSRSDRASDVAGNLENTASGLRGIVEKIRYLELDEKERTPEALEELKNSFESIGEPDMSDLESLADEIRSWADNMGGTGLENTGKYSEVEECAEALESIDTSIDMPTWDETDLSSVADECESCADDLEGKASEITDVNFPRMY